MPNDPSTYATLVTTLANWLNRDDLSTTEIPEAISLAERRFQRELFIPEQETTTTITATVEVVSLPSDFLRATDVHLSTDPKVVLEPVPLSDLRNRYSTSESGRPQNYAIRGESMVLGPVPDTTYTINLAYVGKFTALGTANTTSALLTDHPDVYVHGALAELHLLLADEQRSMVHNRKYEEIAASINRHTVKRRNGGPTIRIRSPMVV